MITVVYLFFPLIDLKQLGTLNAKIRPVSLHQGKVLC